ncbi:MAG: sigma-54-dependent transcriptional regulator, partial [Planctomycetota bacterium]
MAVSVLIAEDESVLRESLAALLTDEGFEVVEAEDGVAAKRIVLDRPVDIVLTDVRMPQADGLDLLEEVRRSAPETPVIVMTAYGTVDAAVQAMRAGARDYILKPVKFDDLLVRVQRALEFSEVTRDRRMLSDQLASQSSFHEIVAGSQQMLQLFDLVRKLNSVKSTVLVSGESGTGKELVARALHFGGVTREKPFVAVNCGAIPESLIESELFGHRRGAFTGAVREKQGFFEAADGGSIFLDEISTLPHAAQSSLLRVLEERSVVPVGDTRPRPVDVRVIAATNQGLEQLERDGTFRSDLLYRLNVVSLHLPPLRERREDIPLLVHHFIAKFTAEMGKEVSGITNGAMRAMLNHAWPGNVR